MPSPPILIFSPTAYWHRSLIRMGMMPRLAAASPRVKKQKGQLNTQTLGAGGLHVIQVPLLESSTWSSRCMALKHAAAAEGIFPVVLPPDPLHADPFEDLIHQRLGLRDQAVRTGPLVGRLDAEGLDLVLECPPACGSGIRKDGSAGRGRRSRRPGPGGISPVALVVDNR